MRRFVFNVSIALVLLCSTTGVSAHVLENLGNAPIRMNVSKTTPVIPDPEMQRMALDMEHAECKKLLALDERTRGIFLVFNLFLPRKGALKSIVGPDCMFLGNAVKIATIKDPALTMGGATESLYFLPDMHALIVSHTADNSIAYGMFFHENVDPLAYFLARRKTAEKSAALARTFSTGIASKNPPAFTDPLRAAEIVERPFASPLAVFSKHSPSPRTGTAPASQVSSSSVVAANASSPDNTDTPIIGPANAMEEEAPARRLWIWVVFFSLIAIGVLIFTLRQRRIHMEK